MNQTFSQQELRNWHKSMTTRVANVAEEHGRSKESIQYQLVFECFLSRIFGEPSSGWTLKGGTALLMRNGSGRFTKDVELARAHEWEEINRIAQELEKLAQRTGADPFTFKVAAVRSKQTAALDGYATPSATVTVEARLGAKSFRAFTVDVTVGRHTQTPPEQNKGFTPPQPGNQRRRLRAFFYPCHPY